MEKVNVHNLAVQLETSQGHTFSAEDKLSSVLKLAEGISMLISVLTVQMDTGKVFFSDMEE
jgi:hypothetical protein